MAADRELSHAKLEQVDQMEQNARDCLLRYQYNMAKAFEYETVTPYQSDFLNRILRISGNTGTVSMPVSSSNLNRCSRSRKTHTPNMELTPFRRCEFPNGRGRQTKVAIV